MTFAAGQAGAELVPREHLAASGDIFDCHNSRWWGERCYWQLVAVKPPTVNIMVSSQSVQPRMLKVKKLCSIRGSYRKGLGHLFHLCQVSLSFSKIRGSVVQGTGAFPSGLPPGLPAHLEWVDSLSESHPAF